MDKTQEQIEKLREKVYEVYDSIEHKGGTIPEELTIGNMPNAVLSIQSGGGGGSAQSFNDVTLIGVGLQTMFVRAPKGLLKESDKPVFARYRKSKIRGSDDGNYWAGENYILR